MAYHSTSRPPARNSIGSIVLLLFFLLAGGAILATMLEKTPTSARIYLAEDISSNPKTD